MLEQIAHQIPYPQVWLPLALALGCSVLMMWAVRPEKSPPAKLLGDEFDELTASAISAPEQRKARRRHGNPVQVHYSYSEVKNTAQRGYVIDRSLGGLRISTNEPVNDGAILVLRPVDASPMVPWVEVEVRSCKPHTNHPGEYELGCQFVKTPPYSILLLYG